MSLRNIFRKPVDRPIEGVIKADDNASLRLEVEEYILTREVTKRLDEFLDAYNDYQGANGVWISGFFGSGKSHLLKMLALLLENRDIDGKPVLDMFLDKPELSDEILSADLERAVAIPSKSILFNIDQKADVISKAQFDALLSVFVKVFDETCGYYGKQGHIAQFERDLEGRELYDGFKDAYKKIAGQEWAFGREQALLEGPNIAKAYAQVSGESEDAAKGILDKYRSEYKVSIEDFANQVNAYLEQQEPNFRLNFFVDEVGQYIANNVKLMTNLQTIAESLATKSRGRAWVIVTAQEDMNSVLGEMDKQQGNDFSKIQARFKTRMKLTSADVAEVIQKRLLTKNEDGISTLSDVYHTQQNNFKTLFDFADGSQTYRNFTDRDHFIHCYPFIPYQFTLFQSAIQSLSAHNAFEGKHSSVGERSMLGVFQQVAKGICDKDVGELATFDFMFSGIRTALKSRVQSSISTAEGNLDNQFAIRVLKALFLVKYVKEFRGTLRNLCVLMLDGFDRDVPALRKQVEEALNLLEQQTYIQRNGEEYEFLTDEEKDVEEEIKSTDVETEDIRKELSTITFDQVLRNRKIRYDGNGQDYPFTRKLDERLDGREQELSIHVISPFHEHAGDEITLKSQSMGKDELLVVLTADSRLMTDLKLYKQTDKYFRHHYSTTQQDSVKRILESKQSQNTERQRDIIARASKLLASAKLFVSGDAIESGSEDPQTRIIQGFHTLVQRTYPNLRMLRGVNYTENQVGAILADAGATLPGTDMTSVSEAEQEILSAIQSDKRSGVRTTLKSLLERFSRKPYGWYYAAILCTLAKVTARGKVAVKMDSNPLDGADLERAFINTQKHANVILEPQVEYTASQIRQLKTFYEEFFDRPAQANEAKALGQETAEAFKTLTTQLETLMGQKALCPFLEQLQKPVNNFSDLSRKPYTFFLEDLSRLEDNLFDMKEATVDPIVRFMSGPMKVLYGEANKLLTDQSANLSYVEGDDAKKLRAIVDDTECYKGSKMQQARGLVDNLRTKVADKLKAERETAIRTLNVLRDRMMGMDEYAKLTDDQKSKVAIPFDELKRAVDGEQLMAVIRDRVRSMEDSHYQQILADMCSLATLKPTEEDYPKDPAGGGGEVNDRQPEFVPIKGLRPTFDKAVLSDETDVDQYLAALKQELIKQLDDGKRIQV